MNRIGTLLYTIRITLVLGILIAATLVGGTALADHLEYRLREIRSDLVTNLETAVSQEISWESVSPSVLRGLTVYGVRVSGNQGTAESVSISVRLREILRGNSHRAVPTVVIRSPTVVLDSPGAFRQLEETIAFFRRSGTGRRIITVRIENGFLQAETDEATFGVSDFQGEFRVDATRVRGDLRGDISAHSTLDDDGFRVRTRVVGTIDSDRSGDPAGATLELSRIESSHFSAADQTVRLERAGGSLHLERIRSRDALDLVAQIDVETREVRVTARSRDVIPSALVTFRGPWKDFNAWITTPITTRSTATLRLDGSFVEAEGTIDSSVNHPSLPEPFGIQAEFRLSPQRFDFASLSIDAPRGTAGFSGSWHPGTRAPDGRIQFTRFSYAGSPVIDGHVTVSGSTDSAGMSADRITVDGLSIYHLVARHRSGTFYDSLEASLSLEQDFKSQVRATVRFADWDDFTGELELIDISATRAGTVARSFGSTMDLPDLLRETRISGSARFDLRAGDTIVRVPYMSVTDRNDSSRLASISGEYRNGNISLTHYYLRYGEITLSGEGSAVVYSNRMFTFSTEFTVNQVEYYLKGSSASDGSLSVSGPYGFAAEFRVTEGGGIAFKAVTQDAPLPLGRTRVSADAEGVFYTPTDWYLNIRELNAREIPLPGPGVRTGSITMSVAIHPETLQIAVTEMMDSTGILAGMIEIRYAFSADGPEISASGRLAGIDSDELYRIALRYSAGAIAMDVRFANSPASRISSRIERGTIDGTIQAVGTFREPEIRAFIESERLITNGNAASVRFLVHSNSSVLRMTGGEFGFGTVRLDVPQIIVDREEGTIDGSLRFRRLDEDVLLRVSGTTDAIPVLSPQVMFSNDIDLSVQASRGTDGSTIEDPRAWHYRLSRTGEMTVLNRQDGAIQASLADSGEFDLRVGGDLAYRGNASGIVTPTRVEVTVSDIRIDLSRLTLPPAVQAVHIDRGTVTGSLRMLGFPGDPDFFGTLTIQGAVLNTPLSPDALGPINTTLIFEEKLIRVPETRVMLGQAPTDLSLRLLLNRFALEQYEIEIDLPGENGAHIVSEFGPVHVDGYARGSLLVSGTPRNLNVTGSAHVYGTELAVSSDFQPETLEGPNAVVDLTIRTGRAVRFIWPDTELPILRSNFATGQEVALRVDTRADTFSLVGDVEIQSGDVFYFDRNFLIRTGRVVFRETQDDFDPRLTARAELRETTPDGPVRIYLVADGQRLSEFSPRFESSPPLDGAEIVAILGGSILQTGSDGSSTLPTALLSTSDIVTRFGFFRQFENSVREQLNLDLFSIRTSFVRNILLTAITPVDEQVQQQVTPSLGTYLNNTSMFMGRYIGDAVFAQLVLQMSARDPEIFPEDDGIQRLGGVLIDSEISLEWQTPFFLLEWNFAPQNPEELFIRDNIFSFLWSFSY